MSIAASAVLIDGPDGSRDVAPFSMPVLNNIGVRGCCTAIYLGNGIALTANHVGAGDVSFGGKVYPYVPGTAVQLSNGDGTYADLLIFEIYPRPDLPALELAPRSPDFRTFLLVAGNGLDRGTSLVWNPNGSGAPGLISGYAWGSRNNVRWGTNALEVYPAGGMAFNTHAFGSFFDAGTGWPESQAVVGDSGGGAFTISSGYWQLAGMIICIVQYSGQPANTSFFGQKTYYADLAYYGPQIAAAVALPEPDRGLLPAVALLAALAFVRRSPQPVQPPRRWAADSIHRRLARPR